MTESQKPRLYHNPASYYSMIARLALAESGLVYERVFVDIHLRASQQRPDYVRLNPNMTVPSPTLPGRILDQSRNIAEYALGVADGALDAETKFWVDLHYDYPIEELTFGGFLSRNPMARIMIPRMLAAAHRRLLARVAAYPDLAGVYKARAAVFAERVRVFDPDKAVHLSQTRRAEAIGFMDQIESHLADGRGTLVPPTYGLADVVWTVFLARMEFSGLGAEIDRRPALARYWRTMQARPSFTAADIWTRLHVLRLIGGILGIGRQ
ncbi:MAG: glutathione S-transferase family protein [Beijerinckiaceae bacterium]|nr:MAG: glutathione S-transferase family protein [Beijerinckiaceae bacterium]